MFVRSIFRSPDGDGGAGGGTGTATPDKGAGNAPAATIKVGDKEYTPEQVAEFQGQATRANELIQANRVLFDGTKSASEREAAARTVFASTNTPKAQVDQWVKDNITGDQGGGDETEQTNNSQPNEALDRANQAHTIAMEGRKAQLENSFAQARTSALDTDTGLRNLLKAAERLQGPEKVPAVRAMLEEALQEVSMANFRETVTRTGKKLDEAIISEGVKVAAKKVVERYSAVIGDASSLGRSSETVTASNPFANGKKPAPAPQWKEGKNAGDLEREATQFLRDELLVMSHEQPGKASGI